MKLSDIEPIASRIRMMLAPVCDRIEIAGSIRRRRPDVGDIELVCIPKQVQTGLFPEDIQVDPGFIQAVNKMPAIKGEPTGKYTQRKITFNGKDVMVDIFMTRPRIWGSIFAIRTGSADYSHYVLAKEWTRKGWRSEEGVLVYGEGPVTMTFSEEEDLFGFLGLNYLLPEERDEAGLRAKERHYKQ